MRNEPNMYRVTYKVMEGNNYAGGWGERTASIKELGDLERFKHIIKVVPAYIEEGEPLHGEIIAKAISDRRLFNEKQRKALAVKDAERELKKAKQELTK